LGQGCVFVCMSLRSCLWDDVLVHTRPSQPQPLYTHTHSLTHSIVVAIVKDIVGSYKFQYHPDGPEGRTLEVDFTPPFRYVPTPVYACEDVGCMYRGHGLNLCAVCVCVSLSLSLSFSVCVCVCVSFSLSLYVCLSVCPSLCVFVSLSFLCAYVCVCLSLSLSVCNPHLSFIRTRTLCAGAFPW
jgi:hypothetical protein